MIAWILGPTFLQDNTTLLLDAGDGFDAYEWSTGELNQKINVNTSGRYWVTAYNVSGEYFGTDTISVIFKCDPQGACPQGFECIDGYCIDNSDCADVVCPEGQVCYQGGCFPNCVENDPNSQCYFGQEFETAPCENVICAQGSTCHEGGCFPVIDSCEGVNCPEGQVCYEGACFIHDACANVSCTNGEACYLGSCFPFITDTGENITMQGDVTEETEGNSTKQLKSTTLPLQDIEIVLFNEAMTGFYSTAVSDSEGKFEFLNLASRTYKVFVNHYPFNIRGNALITLTTENYQNNLQISLVDGAWEIALSKPTNITDNKVQDGLSIYPNPTRSSIYTSSTRDLGKVDVRIYSPLGGLLKQQQINIHAGDSNLLHEFSSDQDGFYFVQITKDGKTLLSTKVLMLGN